MTLGAKIARERKNHNYTQEQLAGILGVSRQSISKWESDVAYPETDKLVKLGKLFDCSMDYLLNEAITDPNGPHTGPSAAPLRSVYPIVHRLLGERKSERHILGMPLYHVGRSANGFIAVGMKAKGVFAVGLYARGVVSLGLLSTGIISFGLLSIGLLALGVFALGIVSAGAIALGLLAMGAICIGIISVGALSVGCFATGALAIGKYAAVGDTARAMIAFGKTSANAGVFGYTGPMADANWEAFYGLLDQHTPQYLSWAKELFKLFFS